MQDFGFLFILIVLMSAFLLMQIRPAAVLKFDLNNNQIRSILDIGKQMEKKYGTDDNV